MRSSFIVIALAFAFLAGCSGKDTSTDEGPSASETSTTTSTSFNNTTTNAPPLPDPVSSAPFTMTGPCQELLLIVSIPVAQARAFVPANYTLLGESSGRASGFIALKECSDLLIDGVSIGPASTSDVGVFVDKGEPGVFHYYQTWWTTDNPQLWARLHAQGWHGGVSNDTLTPLGDLPLGMPGAAVAYANATYTISGNGAAGALTGDNSAVGWFDGPLGTVTVDKVLAGTRLGSGPGTMTGTGEAAALFGASAQGDTLWNEYELDGTVGPI